VTNWSYRTPRVRFHVPVSVSYGSDPRAVEEALLEAAAKNEHVLKEPAPTVLFAAFGESSLDFELACWTSVMLHRRSALRSELNYGIHAALTDAASSSPSPSATFTSARRRGSGAPDRERGRPGRGGTEDAAPRGIEEEK
jgi:small-conductance mechanosensitive channel